MKPVFDGAWIPMTTAFIVVFVLLIDLFGFHSNTCIKGRFGSQFPQTRSKT